jgi:hypothetical protein
VNIIKDSQGFAVLTANNTAYIAALLFVGGSGPGTAIAQFEFEVSPQKTAPTPLALFVPACLHEP